MRALRIAEAMSDARTRFTPQSSRECGLAPDAGASGLHGGAHAQRLVVICSTATKSKGTRFQVGSNRHCHSPNRFPKRVGPRLSNESAIVLNAFENENARIA